MAGRRRFLKAGLLGTALLALGGSYLVLTRNPEQEQRTVLDALVPALLLTAPGFDPSKRSQVVEMVQMAIRGLPLHAQQELDQLFGLLASKPGQWLAGVPAWSEATPEQLASFLTGWRHHKVDLFKVGYQALHDLVCGTYYSDESTWAALGYGGPLSL